MTRRDIVKKLIRLGLSKQQSLSSVDTFFESIISALQTKKKVSILGLGNWEWRERPKRVSRHPKTGKRIHLHRREVLFFSPAPLLKKKLRGDSHSEGKLTES